MWRVVGSQDEGQLYIKWMESNPLDWQKSKLTSPVLAQLWGNGISHILLDSGWIGATTLENSFPHLVKLMNISNDPENLAHVQERYV